MTRNRHHEAMVWGPDDEPEPLTMAEADEPLRDEHRQLASFHRYESWSSRCSCGWRSRLAATALGATAFWLQHAQDEADDAR